MSSDRTATATRRVGLIASLALVVAACAGAASPSPSPAPPSAAAGGMTIASKGDFHPVDGSATGIGELAMLPDGAYEIILDRFSIATIEHANLVLVSNADVVRTTDIDQSKLLDLGPLKATGGMQTYPIPASMAGGVIDGYHTVVIWV
jgi:hypothetical protein